MDGGLLQGLAEGLKSGFGAYQTERSYQDKKRQDAEELALKKRASDLQQKQYDAGIFEKGVVEKPPGADGTSGGFAYTPDVQAKKDYETAGYDPNSERSQRSNQIAAGVLNSASPGMGKIIPKGTSATELAEGEKGFLGKAVTGGFGTQGRALTSERIKGSNDARAAALDERKNVNAANAGKEFEHDPIIKVSKTNLNSLTRSQSILDNPNKPVTAKDLNLAYTDYINAVAAGGAATEGKINRELPETWATEFNNFKAKGGEFDDLRKSTTGAKLINMLKENISTVRSDIQQAAADQALSIHGIYSANTNQKVQDTIKNKLKAYAPEHYARVYGDQDGAQSGPAPQGLLKASPGLLPKQAPAASAPKAGYVEAGFEFQGGDPADPKSWKKVQ